MKIKKSKLVNLPQLIEWAWENGETGEFIAINNEYIAVEIYDGNVDTDNLSNVFPNKNTRFEITEEVEIDKDTELNFVIVDNDDDIHHCKNKSIGYRLNNEYHRMYGTKFIYLQNEDGSIGELIWKDGEMVGDE